MASKSSRVAGEAQEVSRSVYEAVQALAETQINVLQQLANIQRDQFTQALETARDQLRLVSQMRDPRAFASAQADLLKDYGQKYLTSVDEAVRIITTAWEEYGDQLGKSMKTATDAFQRAAETAAQGTEEAVRSATASTRKGGRKPAQDL
jgi:hypothetical protein